MCSSVCVCGALEYVGAHTSVLKDGDQRMMSSVFLYCPSHLIALRVNPKPSISYRLASQQVPRIRFSLPSPMLGKWKHRAMPSFKWVIGFRSQCLLHRCPLLLGCLLSPNFICCLSFFETGLTEMLCNRGWPWILMLLPCLLTMLGSSKRFTGYTANILQKGTLSQSARVTCLRQVVQLINGLRRTGAYCASKQ